MGSNPTPSAMCAVELNIVCRYVFSVEEAPHAGAFLLEQVLHCKHRMMGETVQICRSTNGAARPTLRLVALSMQVRLYEQG